MSSADNQDVLAYYCKDSEYITRKLIEEFTKWELEDNINKTEYICIEGFQQDLVLEDTQQLIQYFNKYKNLGMYMYITDSKGPNNPGK